MSGLVGQKSAKGFTQACFFDINVRIGSNLFPSHINNITSSLCHYILPYLFPAAIN